MIIPRVDHIDCRLIGGPTGLQNKLIHQDKYHPIIVIANDMIYEYVDSGIVNGEKEHLFIHQPHEEK